jgi:membrane fusion protein (multidrug efflux system)
MPEPTPENTTKEPNRKRQHLLLILGLFFSTIGILFLLYWLFIGQFYESTDDAYVSGNLVEVMAQVTGNVTDILADETDLVQKGQPLIHLDKANEQVALQNAQSQLALTIRKVKELYDSIAQLKADIALQQANKEKADDDYQRRLGLKVDQVISKEDLEHARIAAISAKDSLTSAQNKLTDTLDEVGTTDLYHHPQIQQAAATFRDAYLNYERTTLFAPETGYVAKRPVQVGQQVTPNTVLMIIVPLNEVWVNANFKESQLQNMRIGQPATVISDLYGNKVRFKGTVVGLNPGTGSSFDLLPPQNATGNWIKIVQRLPVRISIDAEQLKQHPLRIGLSMLVSVDTHNREGKSLSQLAQSKILYETQAYSSDINEANKLIDKILQENAPNIPAPTAE